MSHLDKMIEFEDLLRKQNEELRKWAQESVSVYDHTEQQTLWVLKAIMLKYNLSRIELTDAELIEAMSFGIRLWRDPLREAAIFERQGGSKDDS